MRCSSALAETCASQQETHEQIVAELEAIKGLRAEVTASVVEARSAIAAAQSAAVEVRISTPGRELSRAHEKQGAKILKRKREEAEDDTPVPANLTDVRDLQAPPPRKRRRALRVAAAIAQTATAATFGAAAAWAALAFS